MFSGSVAAKKEEENCGYLLIWCGEKGNDITNTRSDVSDEDREKLKTHFERFSNHVEPKCNPVFCRYKFHKRVQTEAGTVEKIVTDLKLLVRECSLKEPDELSLEQIVVKLEKVNQRGQRLDPGQGNRHRSNI